MAVGNPARQVVLRVLNSDALKPFVQTNPVDARRLENIVMQVAAQRGLDINAPASPNDLFYQQAIEVALGTLKRAENWAEGVGAGMDGNPNIKSRKALYSVEKPGRPGFWGAVQTGMEDVAGRTYISDEPLTDGQYRGGFAHLPSAKIPEQYSYDGMEKMGYHLGQGLGGVFGNSLRSILWNASAPELTANLAADSSYRIKGGFPGPFKWKESGKEIKYPGSPQATLAGYATGMLGVEGLLMGSGAYNPLNLAEGMRPAGYTAISADEDDPRKSTNPTLDIASRYLFGRRGRILPWEEFSQERPDITYDQYKAYKDWRYGEGNDPISDLTMGAIQFTGSNLEGIPELSLFGIGITPVGLLTGALGAATGRGLHSAMARRSLNEYASTMEKLWVNKQALTDAELASLERNPFHAHDKYLESYEKQGVKKYSPHGGFYIDKRDLIKRANTPPAV